MFGIGLASCRAPELGVREGTLTPCPGRPNCVNSQDPDPAHRVEPLRFEGSPEVAWARARAIVSSWPRTEVIVDEPGYLRAVSTSLVFRFRDDLELLLDEAGSQIHVRAGARMGYSDFGVNRGRVASLRAAFDEEVAEK